MQPINDRAIILFLIIIFTTPYIIASESATSAKIDPTIERYTQHLGKGVSYVWATDPFLKTPGFAAYKNSPITYVLHAVIYSEQEKSAIVNNREVFVGSMIDDYRVAEIGRNFVILDNGTSLQEINVPSNPVTSHAEIEAIRSPASEENANDN